MFRHWPWLILAMPMLLLAAAVRATSRGPAIHWSKRVGRHDRLFLMPKFRTMRIDTPQVATHLLTDPDRWLTPIGGFLRRSSLDELPQLFSVLAGDMSLVGPRPALFNQDDLIAQRTQQGRGRAQARLDRLGAGQWARRVGHRRKSALGRGIFKPSEPYVRLEGYDDDPRQGRRAAGREFLGRERMGLFSFGAKKQRNPENRPSTGGRLIYAIGDVHGRLDLLQDLLRQIGDDADRVADAGAPVLVFLGDYVDRGAYSRGVIDCLIGLSTLPDIEMRALKGNHEQAMLSFLADPEIGPAWVQQGGAATLVSYGVAAPQTRIPHDLWQEASEALAEALPPEHLRFLESLELYAEYGDYVFVHAGLKPGVPIERQSEQDLL